MRRLTHLHTIPVHSPHRLADELTVAYSTLAMDITGPISRPINLTEKSLYLAYLYILYIGTVKQRFSAVFYFSIIRMVKTRLIVQPLTSHQTP